MTLAAARRTSEQDLHRHREQHEGRHQRDGRRHGNAVGQAKNNHQQREGTIAQIGEYRLDGQPFPRLARELGQYFRCTHGAQPPEVGAF